MCTLLPAKYEVYNKSKEAMNNVNRVNFTTDCGTSQLLLIISDNASNIRRTIKEELEFSQKFTHFGCYAHTVNLIAQIT